MLSLLKNRIFSSAVHSALLVSMENGRTTFETLDTGLLDALCHVNSEGKMSDRTVRSTRRVALEKKIAFDPRHRNLNCQ